MLARARNVEALSRPAPSPATRRGFLAGHARMPPFRLMLVLGATALLVGIAVNALWLQRGRHPAPLFAPSRSKASQASSIAVSSSTFASSDASRNASASAPIFLPPATWTAGGSRRESHTTDEIGDLLRGGPQDDASRLVLAAQSALAKLGYGVKADGALGSATQQALRDFERAHALPLTTEITPHLLKQLLAAARANGR